MPRIRNFLIDNTLGKIFTNVQTVNSANASNLIAGTKLQTKTVSTGNSVTLRITNNISNIGFYFPTDSLLTTATLRLSKAAKVSNTKLRFRSGTTYASSVIIADNVSIPINTLITTVSLNTLVNAGNYVYVDVINASPLASSAGNGLSVILSYYGN